MRGYHLADTRGGRGAQQGPAGGVRTEGTPLPGGEQQRWCRPLILPVAPEHLQEGGTEHNQALAAALGVADVDDPAQGVNVLGLQGDRLADAQAGGVDQGEEHAVLGHGEGPENPVHLGLGEDHRQRGVLPRHGDEGHLLGLAEGFPEQEGQGRIVATQPFRADGLTLEMLHPPADFLLGCLVGCLSGHLLEAADGRQILLDGSLGTGGHLKIRLESRQSRAVAHVVPPWLWGRCDNTAITKEPTFS